MARPAAAAAALAALAEPGRADIDKYLLLRDLQQLRLSFLF
jgi:hypothetical protein